jgi:hypothetical protein
MILPLYPEDFDFLELVDDKVDEFAESSSLVESTDSSSSVSVVSSSSRISKELTSDKSDWELFSSTKLVSPAESASEFFRDFFTRFS